MNALSNIHFFRRVPRDMTEGTAYGGMISIVGGVVMMILFFGELWAYLGVETSSKVVMDQDTGREWAIEFNITMAHIPCKYASVDIADRHGMVQHNVTTNIERWHVDEKFEPYLEHVAHDALEYEEVDHPEDGDRANLELTSDIFEDQLNQFPVTMVVFHAPWCMWCRKLAPVWEHAARSARDKFNQQVLFGSVDCTHSDAVALCRSNRIMAFPTIRIFKDGKTRSFQDYEGPRRIESLVDYAQHQRWTTDSLYEHDKAEAAKALAAKQASPTASSGERAPGCRLSGHVLVSRAPGDMHITISQEGKSFAQQHINVSHLVHHFSFGDLEPIRMKARLRHGARDPVIARVIHALSASGFSALSGTVHVTNENVTQEHYLKVVRTEVRRDNERLPRSASYQYTVTNAQFKDEDEDKLPSAKFSYDLSPMQVLVLEQTRSFTHFLTSVCAIVGGVFTVVGIVDAVVHASVRSLEQKDGMGKLS
eukprot:TRINITY_DN19035_c0_g1_i1.p1 TRINITY_DN19035_c0_g1~~TRINITY_DN19035_c0_g1_i1.p1  ORF type:complete len:480 (-),score=108.79 TRINITY_DN19035_c0_g1_i1:288-1727(-)